MAYSFSQKAFRFSECLAAAESFPFFRCIFGGKHGKGKIAPISKCAMYFALCSAFNELSKSREFYFDAQNDEKKRLGEGFKR